MDLLDDIFDDGAVKTAKAGGKFQPKAKPRPVKKGPAVASSAVSLQSKSTGDTTVTGSIEASRTGKPSGKYGGQSSALSEPSFEHPVAAETLSPFIGSNLGASLIIPDNNGDRKSRFEKSVGENADVYIGADSLDSLPHHSSAVESSIPTTEPSAVHVAGGENVLGQHAIPVVSSDSGICNIQTGEVAAAQDPLTCKGSVVLSGSCQEMDTYPSLEADILGLATRSGQRTGKFHPKLQVYREGYHARIPDSDIGEPVSCQPDGYPGDDVLDVGFDNNIITESATEFPFHEEHVMNASHSDGGIPGEHHEASSLMPEKPVSPRPTTRKQKLLASEVSAFAEENKGGRSLRSRRKLVNALRLVDESEEVLDDGECVLESPKDFATNGNDDSDEEWHGENESLGNMVQKTAKKTVGDEGKQVRKSTKTSKSSDQAEKEKPKRFSHSTRQKRRKVDKALLETPDDEIDRGKVTLGDIILRAEHKERLMKKDAAASHIPTTDKSAGTSFPLYDENDTYASDEGGEAHEQSSPRVQDSSVYFNYQTYMEKTPSTRWSKQDTELFYEAVRQFGTDLSLIQNLFPGRTRRQVKLKYKKEERQQPFRLHDALTSRAKDHSHFEQVIQRLKQSAAEERDYAANDESVDLIGEEEAEGTPKINEECEKSEHIKEKEAEDVGQDVPEMQSPVKDSDSDEDNWFENCQYKPM